MYTMNQREKQRRETKRRIYDCAFRLFVEKDYANVKVQDIAEEAGISIGGLYHHYRSKEDILDYGYFEFDEKLKELYENTEILSPHQGIHTLIRYQMQACVDRGVRIISITFRNQINAENTYRYSDQRYLWTSLLDCLKQAGLDDKTAAEAAAYLLRTSRGCVYDWCCRNGKFDLIRETEAEIEMILEHYGIA